MAVKIVGARLFVLRIPLRSPFTHAGAARSQTQSVVLELVAEDGTRGYGEGAPRKYVTGETLEDCVQSLSRLRIEPLPVATDSEVDARGIQTWVGDQLATVVDGPGVVRNAARCALDVALLDLVGQSLRRPAQSMIPLGRAHGDAAVHHSMVCGGDLLKNPREMAAIWRRYRYRSAKAKVGFGLAADLENLRRLREAIGDIELRVDANSSWTVEEAVTFSKAAEDLGLVAIEDPVAGQPGPKLWGDLARFKASSPLLVVLDESLRTVDELRSAAQADAVDVINVRLSKAGGFLGAAAQARTAGELGVQVQIGCQAGETAILSAAARHLAFALPQSPRFLEGSNEDLKFESHQFLSEENLTYGVEGAATKLPGPGLGIRIMADRLEQLSDQIIEVELMA